jgi:hypothetical protein
MSQGLIDQKLIDTQHAENARLVAECMTCGHPAFLHLGHCRTETCYGSCEPCECEVFTEWHPTLSREIL